MNNNWKNLARTPESRNLRLRQVLPLVLLLVTALLAYSHNFSAEFVYDDYPFIVENPSIRTLSHPLRFFLDRESFSNKGEYVIYRPFAAISFALNYALNGYSPASYHAVNILLHAVCGLLVYLFFRQLFGHSVYAFFVSLLFLLHPVQTEAVSWISARGNSMFLAFLLLSLMCYRQWTADSEKKRVFYALALMFAAFSLLAKEMAVVLPVLILVHDFSVNRPEKAGEWRKRISALLPFAALSVLYILARHLVLGETKQMDYWGGSFWASSLTMIKAFAYYVRLMFMPRPLMVEYIVPIPQSLLQPTVMLSLLVLLTSALVWLISYRRIPAVGFGIAWFFGSLLPVSNIIPLQAILNERFLYLPSIGFCAALAAPLLIVSKVARPLAYKGMALALGLIAFGYGLLTFDRNSDWRDSLSLWTASVKASPLGTTSRYNLGLELYKRGQYDEAIEHLQIACRFQEHFPSAHGVLGNVYLAKGKWDAAIREYDIGLRQAPQDERMLHNLALAWFEKGSAHAENHENAQAVQCFLTALGYQPEFTPAKEKLQQLRGAVKSESAAKEKPVQGSRL
ncbi:MAG: tetratricopeptide repeat protein [Candidatus Abyssobacteria bacterium SURF_5]|uniref:Tetratricopeptide repeat protein n=1 Tax=Abyssobacteria bacterium (strain SURF_5) TaxID=2093360 RepID=A0A3A4P364_ABYX5|nr:MAG: tetratricopeptide repeat protein [Candidatus Abyssubacteria bacterium SURF_5]